MLHFYKEEVFLFIYIFCPCFYRRTLDGITPEKICWTTLPISPSITKIIDAQIETISELQRFPILRSRLPKLIPDATAASAFLKLNFMLNYCLSEVILLT